jgi:AcrR family transcriptional regulator
VPRLWTETIATHRQEVREAILETTAALVRRRGLRAVTMSEIAEETGIGRATLYKYFPDVEAILVAWHERHVGSHLEHLAELARQPGDPAQRLAAVLHAYALIQYKRRGTDVDAWLHRQEHMAPAQQRMIELLEGLLAEGTRSGQVRDDASPRELASYCLHALEAAGSAGSEACVRRLVEITLDGLRQRAE